MVLRASPAISIPLRYEHAAELYAALCSAETNGGKVPENGTCSVKIGGYRYNVDFEQRMVTETFFQKVRVVFGRCVGLEHASTTEIKGLFFPARPRIFHNLNPAVAERVLEQQRLGETGERDVSSVLSTGNTPLWRLQPARFTGIGNGARGDIDFAVSGSAGPVRVLKRPKKIRDDDGVLVFDQVLRGELRNEQRVLKMLNHPNVIGIDKMLSSEGQMVMEYGGVSLTKIIQADAVPLTDLAGQHRLVRGDFSRQARRDRDIRQERVISIMRQMLEGLKYLVGEGILHGDIKPDNILVDANTNRVRLTDFGLSQCLPVSGAFSQFSGTPCYMAPEVWAVKRDPSLTYGLPADMYSAGCVFYEMLTRATYHGCHGFRVEWPVSRQKSATRYARPTDHFRNSADTGHRRGRMYTKPALWHVGQGSANTA